MTMRGDDIEPVLAALADPTRRRVLDAVASRAEATATMIAAELPVSRQAVVKHLGVLDQAGLVTGRKAGREMLYTARPEPLDNAARWMDAVAAEWDARLARIKHLAELPASAAETGAPAGDER
ncbi:MAG: helix-turn-helix transcriptional regulator [Thermomicrobiales bacterium]|nr:helix-turn-helix transcriptional regulator [Thermomicrobiales bacterium]